MDLQEPLLRTASGSLAAPALKKKKSVVGAAPETKKQTKSAFEQFIEQRESESMWTFRKKQQQNIKDAQVVELLITRITFYMNSLGFEPEDHRVVHQLGNMASELAEFEQKIQLKDFNVQQFFVSEVEATLKGVGDSSDTMELPNSKHVVNFLSALDKALDEDITIKDLSNDVADLKAADPDDGCKDLKAADPDDKDEDDDSGDDRDEDTDSDVQMQKERRSSEAEEDEEEQDDKDDTGDATAYTLWEKYTLTELKQKLKEQSVPLEQMQGRSKWDLAELLERQYSRKNVDDIYDFAEKWVAWKVKGRLSDENAKTVQALCVEVGEPMVERLDAVMEKFRARFPICEWFVSVLENSLLDEHFGVLWHGTYCDVGEDDLPKVMPWTYLGNVISALKSQKLVDETSLARTNTQSDLNTPLRAIVTKVLPSFLLSLTRIKALMMSQADQVEVLRNKILAGLVTGAMACIQFGVKYFEQ